jgi:hypothetical protein
MLEVARGLRVFAKTQAKRSMLVAATTSDDGLDKDGGNVRRVHSHSKSSPSTGVRAA